MTEKIIWVRRPLRFKMRCCLEGKSLKSKNKQNLILWFFYINDKLWHAYYLNNMMHVTVYYFILFTYFPNSFPPWEVSFFYHFVSFSDLFSCTTLRFTELLHKLTWGNLWVLQTVARMTFRAYFTSSAGLTASVIWEAASSFISRPSCVLDTSNMEENMLLHEVCLSRLLQ